MVLSLHMDSHKVLLENNLSPHDDPTRRGRDSFGKTPPPSAVLWRAELVIKLSWSSLAWIYQDYGILTCAVGCTGTALGDGVCRMLLHWVLCFLRASFFCIPEKCIRRSKWIGALSSAVRRCNHSEKFVEIFLGKHNSEIKYTCCAQVMVYIHH